MGSRVCKLETRLRLINFIYSSISGKNKSLLWQLITTFNNNNNNNNNRLCLARVTHNNLRLTNPQPSNSRSYWNLEMLIFKEGRKPENPEKNPWSKDENQWQTQPTNSISNHLTFTFRVRDRDGSFILPLPYLKSIFKLFSNQSVYLQLVISTLSLLHT